MDEPRAPKRDALFWQALLARSGDGVSRRDFTRLLGASMALSGVGCSVGPTPGEILPYASGDALTRPGLPVSYATTLPQREYGVGVVVKTREGRAIKVEGNPLHPASLGASSAQLQASVLGLYDPDRLRAVRGPAGPTSWAAFFDEMRMAFGAHGEGCAVLLAPRQSPFVTHQLERLHARYEALEIYSHALGVDHTAAGGDVAFGANLEPVVDLTGGQAKRDTRMIVSLEHDFLLTAAGALRHARAFAQLSNVHLTCIESTRSLTGTRADARLAARPQDIENIAVALLRALVPQDHMFAAVGVDAEQAAFVATLAERVRQQSGQAVFLAGAHASALTHACVAALNVVTGAVGRFVQYRAPLLPGHLRGDHLEPLLAALDAGAVQTLLVVGGNPVHYAPGAWRVAQRLARAPRRVFAGLHDNETAQLCGWHLPVSHPLESWGDLQSEDGTVSLMQPVMQPLFDTMSIDDILGALVEPSAARERTALAGYWSGRGVAEEAFASALAQGTPVAQPTYVSAPQLRWDALRAACAAVAQPTTKPGLTVAFRDDNVLFEGDDANNAWLQELSDPISKQAWGNAAWLSEATAEGLGAQTQDWIRIEVASTNAVIECPVVVIPGLAEGVVSVALGGGHTAVGLGVAHGVGVDAAMLLPGRVGYVQGALVTRLDRAPVKLAFTQVPASWRDRPDGAEALSPASQGAPLSLRGAARPARFAVADGGPQWGMAIDLDRCTGCQACIVACQAENNIPVVGAVNVRKGRAMHWLRVDRYFAKRGGDARLRTQPMLCQHCEHAPCEYVCPVGATQHSPDGLNEMVYNRCVGTRYCSNNCPYKVRRFNWFAFHNESDPIARMVYNPEVTVRSRGVMEKCTFCVQRIRAAGIRAKITKHADAASVVVTACQEACPSQAILFGDLSRKDSAVQRAFDDSRATIALSELGTRPRVRYLKSQG